MNNLADLFYKHFGKTPKVEPLNTGSGSSRSYFRLTDEDSHTAIGTIGTSREENDAFLYATRHFLDQQLPVPQVYAVSDDHMAYLQEDLGSLSLYQAIKSGRESGENNSEHSGNYSADQQALLCRTIRLLPQFQIRGGKDFDTSYCYPSARMDAESVMFDLNYFKYCFLKLQSDIDFNEHLLQADFCRLSNDIDALSAHSQTLILRDFQARNVMLKPIHATEGGDDDVRSLYAPYFIDYQGCRLGPAEYDVASFLWQASAHYPNALRSKLTDEYIQACTALLPTPASEIRRRLRLMVLFRTMQVLGAYGFRGLIQGKEYFIRSIPAAKANLKEIIASGGADNYPCLKEILYNIAKAQAPSANTKTTPAKEQAPAANTKTMPAKELAPLTNAACAPAAIAGTPRWALTVTIYSFSYKKGLPQDPSGNGGGYVFDCRSTHNPGKYDEYKPLTGLDKPVIEFLEKDGEITRFLAHVFPLVDHHVERFLERGFSHMMVCFGCTGGRHRSVYSAQHLARHLRARFPNILIHLIHREQGIDTWE